MWREPVRLEGKLEPDEDDHRTCEGCWHLIEVEGVVVTEYICGQRIEGVPTRYVEAFEAPDVCPCGGREWEGM